MGWLREENIGFVTGPGRKRAAVRPVSVVPSVDPVWEDARLPTGLWGDAADRRPLDVGEWHHRCLPAARALRVRCVPAVC